MTTLSPARLICASKVAYKAIQNGIIPPYDDISYTTVGFLEPPTSIIDGPRAINACIVGSIPEGVIVAFRGTIPLSDTASPFAQRIRDWCQDFRAELCTAPGFPGMVHSGYMASLNTLWNDTIKEVNRQLSLSEQKALYMTGHSKGGAMATMAAWKWYVGNRVGQAKIGLRIPTVTTFASPRPGDTNFATAISGLVSIERFEGQDDIVPFLPPHETLGAVLNTVTRKRFDDLHDKDYQSVGQLFFVDENGNIQSPLGKVANIILKNKRSWQFVRLFVTFDFDDIVLAHEVESYRSRIMG